MLIRTWLTGARVCITCKYGPISHGGGACCDRGRSRKLCWSPGRVGSICGLCIVTWLVRVMSSVGGAKTTTLGGVSFAITFAAAERAALAPSMHV